MVRLNKGLIGLSLIFLIVAILLFSGCLYKIPEDPNTFTKSIMHDGLERTYRIHIPPSFNNNTPVPLVFALHGGLGTGEGMERSLTLGGFNTLSDQDGFIVVYFCVNIRSFYIQQKKI